ncbi:phosphoribosylformylglycinamidine synthase subunit PurQ [uncultured Hymenobacter sp.]|uniref:phosphoribosylformylglycinamidine synthase subunit PurQ n=1 Tax=uncultured Hymenobacter sp. TaxID=170016 RepID=UPI0035CC3A9C
MQALVLTGFGINCEEEVAAAYRLAGAEATIVHLNQVLHGEVSIHDFDVLTFPGGFSFGDDLGSGVVLANKLRYRQTGAPDGQRRTLLDDLKEFVAAGKFVLGICNGFQVLVKLGLLPNLGGGFQPEVTLTHNASGRYENRWVRLQVNPNTKSPFLAGLTTLEVPVRHGEGRLVLPDDATAAALEAAGLNCLSYVDAAGDGTSQYPLNPNGAALNCAGLTDTTGQILGLMPHPEAFLMAENHPDWARRKRLGGAGGVGDGLAIFRNIVRHVALRGNPTPLAPLPDGEGGTSSSFSSSLTTPNPTTKSSLETSPPSPSGKGLGDGVAEEPRPHYTRRQQPTPEPTSIPDNVFTTTPQQWKNVKSLGRAMRQAPTPAEDALWQALRAQQLGVKFRRQHTIDSFIVDFVSLPDKLVIEVDGAVHGETEQAIYDAGRSEILRELGYRIIRFSNETVLQKLPEVLEDIKQNITSIAANT